METKIRLSSNLLLSVMLPLALLCLLLLAACSGEAPGTVASAPPTLALAPPPPPADSMHVYDSTYTRVSRAFADGFDAGVGVPLLYVEQEIAWDLFAAHVPADDARYHGVMAEYGLENDSLRFGFSYFRLDTTATRRVFTYRLPATLYDLSAGALSSVDTTTWKRNFQYNSSNPGVYFSKVRVQHKPGGSFTAVDYTTDAHADVMAWENELMVMHDENATGHGDSTLFVVVGCIAKPDAGGDLRNRICYYLRLRPKGQTSGAHRDLLDDSRDPNNLLRMHGGDFGGLRPPGGSYYTEPHR